ncbi:MAG: sulfur carrier protein ThiS [Acidobacteria bacterium]|nr:sulfur carrier protein ThiS [Acidobacteriota bacterium]
MPIVSLNGVETTTPAMSIEELLRHSAIELRGIAVALNGTVVPRSQWSTTPITEGDAIEVVTAAAGG